MSSIEDDVQELISRAVTLSIKAPLLSLPQIMRAAKFTNAQSEDRALQMRVRRAYAMVAANLRERESAIV